MAEVLEGLITELDGAFAKLRPKRHDECGDCQACFAQDLEVLALNPPRAAVGQTVRYIQAQHGMLLIAWVLFLQPLLAIFAGIGLGSTVATFLVIPPGWGVGVAVTVLLTGAVAFILWFDRRYKLNQSNFAKIIEIVA